MPDPTPTTAADPTYIVDESGIPHCSDPKPHRHSSLEAPLVCDLADRPRRTLWDATCWRTGRKVGRTIYAQLDAEPSDDDPLIGVMDTPELAALVVEAVNATR